jgi:hypothetical protein
MNRDDFFRDLYYRYAGDHRRLCLCNRCGSQLSILAECVESEPCDNCEIVDWRELTAEEFAAHGNFSDVLKLNSQYLADQLADLYDYAAATQTNKLKIVIKTLIDGFEGFSDAETAEWLQQNVSQNPKVIEFDAKPNQRFTSPSRRES